MDIREKLIREGLNKWAYQGFNGILEYATGVGKTYAAILASEYIISKGASNKVLIVSPTTLINANNENEFIKFKKAHLLNNVEFICYKSLHKINPHEYSLVVLDECHTMTVKLFDNFKGRNKLKNVLGLSATLTSDKKGLFMLNGIFVSDTIDIKMSRELNLVSDYRILALGVKLTNQERIDYNNLTRRIDGYKNKTGKTNWGSIVKRSNIIYTAINKLEVIPSIIDAFKDEYGLILSLSNETADDVQSVIGDTCISLHSIVAKNKNDKNVILNKFTDGRTKLRCLSASKMIDEGLTIPRLTFGILHSRSSKELQTSQNLGRIIRLSDDDNKIAILIRLYVVNSIEEKWVTDSLRGYDVDYSKNLDELINKIKIIRNENIN